MTSPHDPQDVMALGGPAASRGEEISIWSYANVLLRRRHLMLVLPVASGLLVGTVSLLSTRQYSARASFIPQEPPATQSGLGQLASQLGFGFGARVYSPQFYADLLQSREVLLGVVTTSYRVASSKPFTGSLINYFRLESQPRDVAIRYAMRRLQGSLSVRTDRSTGVVRFDVYTSIPDLSAQVADRFLELLNDYNLRRRQSQARAEREFVEQRLIQAQAEMTSAEEALAAFYRRNRRFQDSPELVFEEARLQRRVSLRQQLYSTLSLNYESAKIEEVRDTPVLTVLERPGRFVEPKARGTVGKATVAVFAAVLLAMILAFGLEYLSTARKTGSDQYKEFLALRREMLADFRQKLFRHAGD